MPGRRTATSLGRRTRNATAMQNRRAERTDEEQQQDNDDARNRMAQLREVEAENARIQRNEERRIQQRRSRRLPSTRLREIDQLRQQENRIFRFQSFQRLAFAYEPNVEYYAHPKVIISKMDKQCLHCEALKFKNEPAGMCCASGKVKLPLIDTPPEPLKSLLYGTDPDSNVFLKSIRTFNSCFQMSSFGATEIVNNSNGPNFKSTFRVKGQIYHKVGSLLPMPNEDHKFLHVDTVCEASEAVNFPTEFLNSLDLPGVPPHSLVLKDGSPIILLRNLNPPRLCNGTRLVVQKLMNNVIEAIILNGKFKGESILIPRIPIIPTDVPIHFKRIQFPIRLAFAMTINKSQGQTLSVCGLDLSTPCFSHGQLYVACSRVGKPSSLFVLAKDGMTKNIVHSVALRN